MISNKTLTLIFLATALGAGCAPAVTDSSEDDGSIAEANQALTIENGIELNGVKLNNTTLNGVKLNGVKLNGVKLNGVKLNGTSLEGTLENTSIVVSGGDLASAEMEGVLGDGSTVTLGISSVSSSEVSGLLTYTINHGGSNVCGSGASTILVPGRWNFSTASWVDDADHFTVACRGAAIAKCVEWGYGDDGVWHETSGGSSHDISMGYFHQACVRMVRADYCGDGKSHTQTGTPIDVFDAKGIQSSDSTMDLEAEWTPSGAACVRHPRWISAANGDVESYIKTNCDSAWAGTDRSSAHTACGGSGSTFFTANGYATDPATRTLLMDKSDTHTPE